MFKKSSLLQWLLFAAVFTNAEAACLVFNSNKEKITPPEDPIGFLLSSNASCPKEVFAFRQLIKDAGLTTVPTMVANKGFHNPGSGSFSLFEIVSGRFKEGSVIKPGDFFFGHFTAVDENNHLIADQNPEKDSLMIEALAWDEKSGFYDFYELRGDGKQGQWFYRGNSLDIYKDNTLLHRQVDAEHPQFGQRLRCSACHGNGGPIMKELYEPHNDWWTSGRKLNLGGRQPDAALGKILQDLVSAENLASGVIAGNEQLQAVQKSQLSLQEQLRPLFCPMEINFVSDAIPNEQQRDVTIPLEFFVDDSLPSSRGLSAGSKLKDDFHLVIPRNTYEQLLQKYESHFPKTSLNDADHPWLTPVKAKSDKQAVAALIAKGLIDDNFVANILSVDSGNPVFSQKRCALLRYVPNHVSANWRQLFIKNLYQSQDKIAQMLAKDLEDGSRNVTYYQQKAIKFLGYCRAKIQNNQNLEKFYLLLLQRRAEIKASEISKNPKGQILEPGFRVIFPETNVQAVPGKLSLDEQCNVVENN